MSGCLAGLCIFLVFIIDIFKASGCLCEEVSMWDMKA
jgi:hypothetical protein